MSSRSIADASSLIREKLQPDLRNRLREEGLALPILWLASELAWTSSPPNVFEESLLVDWASGLLPDFDAAQSLVKELLKLVQQHPETAGAYRDQDWQRWLSEPERLLVALGLVHLASADGDIAASEASWLSKWWTSFGLDRDLHLAALAVFQCRVETSTRGAALAVCQAITSARRAAIVSTVVGPIGRKIGDRVADQLLFCLSSDGRVIDAIEGQVTEVMKATRETQAAIGSMEPYVPRLRRQLQAVIDEHASGEFRIGFVGDFKRGKSSLINALFGLRGAHGLPMADLPCTYLPIEVRKGGKERYASVAYTREGPATTQIDRHEFEIFGTVPVEEQLGKRAAAATTACSHLVLESPELELPDNVVVVDTPGMGEDPARDEISRQSARRCQAVVLVLSATQVGAQTERQAVQALAEEVRKVLVIAINRGDEVKPESHRALCERAASLFAVPADRVHLVSARDGERSEHWAASLQGLWRCINDTLLVKSRILRTRLLMPRLKPVIASARSALVHIESKDRDQAELRRLVEDLNQRFQQASALRLEVEEGKRLEGLRKEIVERVRDLVAVRLRKIRSDLVLESTWSEWTSDKSKLFNPKGHLSDLLSQAQGYIVRRITKWSTKKLPAELEPELARVRSLVKDLVERLCAAAGGNAEDVVLELGKLEADLGVGMDGDRERMSMLGSGAIGAVLGWVIADVILFYWLRLIAGFLHPALLLAMLAGALLKASNSNSWGKGVAEELAKKLEDPGLLEKMVTGIEPGVASSFSRVRRSLLERAEATVGELARCREIVAHELEEQGANADSQQTARAQLSQALDRLEKTIVLDRETLIAMAKECLATTPSGRFRRPVSAGA